MPTRPSEGTVQPAVSLMGLTEALDGKRKRHVDASQESLAVARLDAAFSIRYAIMRHRHHAAHPSSAGIDRRRIHLPACISCKLCISLISCDALLVFVPVWGRSARFFSVLRERARHSQAIAKICSGSSFAFGQQHGTRGRVSRSATTKPAPAARQPPHQ